MPQTQGRPQESWSWFPPTEAWPTPSLWHPTSPGVAPHPSPCCPLLAEESNKKHPFPCPTSYRTALTYYLDITNPPRTNVLYELAQYASEPTEHEQLRKMASSSGEGKVGLPPAPEHPECQPPSPAIPRAAWAPGPLAVLPTSVFPGAIPEVGAGGSAAHPGHPAGLPVPAAPHRPPVRAAASSPGPLLLHRLILQGGGSGPAPVEKTMLAPQRAPGPWAAAPALPHIRGHFAQDSRAVYPEGWTVRSHPALQPWCQEPVRVAARKGP